jgi:hypothetical protein
MRGPVLFVTNGHGEAAIAARIAREVRELGIATEHFPLVGADFAQADFPEVGPRRAMPSGGLVAMFNVGAFARDVVAGWLGLFRVQWRFLAAAGERYPLVVAVGDTYACALARKVRRPLIFVGTAKSVYVTRYGPLEAKILSAAQRIFVRDTATAADLRARGVPAEAPGNVIVDLLASEQRFPWHVQDRIAILPGSRDRAYSDAERLCAVVAGVIERRPDVEAAISLSPTLEHERFAPLLARYPMIRPWSGPLGALLADASIAIGQAGTANEAAAASGIPVLAMELADDRRDTWYRMRQRGLLGDALAILPGDLARAIDDVVSLLDDPVRRAHMGAIGRERMGGRGGAAAIAAAVAQLV